MTDSMDEEFEDEGFEQGQDFDDDFDEFDDELEDESFDDEFDEDEDFEDEDDFDEEFDDEGFDDEERLEGSVKWYSVNKGYGFIAGDDGEDYFVHYTQLPEATILEEDDDVQFTPVEAEKGLQAQDVELE